MPYATLATHRSCVINERPQGRRHLIPDKERHARRILRNPKLHRVAQQTINRVLRHQFRRRARDRFVNVQDSVQVLKVNRNTKYMIRQTSSVTHGERNHVINDHLLNRSKFVIMPLHSVRNLGNRRVKVDTIPSTQGHNAIRIRRRPIFNYQLRWLFLVNCHLFHIAKRRICLRTHRARALRPNGFLFTFNQIVRTMGQSTHPSNYPFHKKVMPRRSFCISFNYVLRDVLSIATSHRSVPLPICRSVERIRFRHRISGTFRSRPFL